MNKLLVSLLVVVRVGLGIHAAPIDQLITDRTAIERVYYNHRIGDKEPFEQILTSTDLRRLVERDIARELALSTHYGLHISTNQTAAEVNRINRTTRAPDVLAEIKTALGNDPARFAESFAKPIVVERELRRRFENDDQLHAPVRRECEALRTNLLAARAAGSAPDDLVQRLARSHPGAVQKTTWVLSSRRAKEAGTQPDQRFYFDEMPLPLRQVLGAQLRAAGDVSAVIETPEDFLLFVAESKDNQFLATACLTLPKADCDAWLNAQSTPAKN